jgi:hypothetical protein
MPAAPLYLTYSVAPDATLPPNTFRFAVTAPAGDPRVFTCNLFNAAGTDVSNMTTTGGTTNSSPNTFDPFEGDTINAHLNFQGSGVPDTVIPLVFPGGVAAGLNQQKIQFAWSSQTVPVVTAGRPLAELDPAGSPVVLSYDVPEPAVYRGRQIVQLDIPASYFVTPTQAAARTSTAAASGLAPRFALPPIGAGPMLDSAAIYPDDALLYGGTPPPERASAGALTEVRITSAFNVARTTGYFDPSVFPNVQTGNDRFSRAGVIQALAGLDTTTVVTQLNAGNRLTLYRDTSGRVVYRFIAAPQNGVPTLLLIETYRLSSFPARYGAGRTIKTFSLLPGERTRIRISSYKRSSEGLTRSSSILDSTTDETESEFEQSVLAEQSSQDNTSRAFEYHAQAQAQATASWGWGNADVSASGGVSGTSNAARDEFAKNVTNAVAHNAARASSRRDVQIDTSLDVKTESGEEQAVERELANVNVSRTLNFVFRQMNQEYVTLLHLVDVRVAFFNGFGESRFEVPLPELDQLLSTYIVPEQQAAVLAAVTSELQSIKDYTGTVRGDFVETVTLGSSANVTTLPPGPNVTYLRVSTEAISQYRAGPDGPVITVPGVIIAADSHIMRTDGVVVDTFLGLGNGLDDYSTGLQQQAVRSRQLENDRLQAEIGQLQLAISIISSGNGASADLYQRLFPVPQVVNQIDQAAVNNPPASPPAPAPPPAPRPATN